MPQVLNLPVLYRSSFIRNQVPGFTKNQVYMFYSHGEF